MNSTFNATAPAIVRDVTQLEYLLVVSNFVLVLPALRAITYKFYTAGTVLFITGIISYLYHLCYGFDKCIARPEVLRFLDHLFASTMPFIIVICFVCILHTRMRRLATVYIILLFLANGLFQVTRTNPKTMSIAQLVFEVVYALIVLITSLCTFSFGDYKSNYSGNSKAHERYDKNDAFYDLSLAWRPDLVKDRNIDYVRLVIGTVICIISFILYACVKDYYSIIHSLWHVGAAVGTDLILQAADRTPRHHKYHWDPHSNFDLNVEGASRSKYAEVV